MITKINNIETEVTKEELTQFCHDEYSTLSHKELVELLVDLDRNSSCFEEMWMDALNEYDDKDKLEILAKIRNTLKR